MQAQGIGATEATLSDIATEVESIALLRRIVKLLEASATVDPRFRQRVTIDAIKASEASVPTELAGTMPISGSVSVSGTMGTALAANGGNLPSVNPPYSVGAFQPQGVWEGPVDQRWRVLEDSRISYGINIRSKLSWS
jgi:hypothetical protein